LTLISSFDESDALFVALTNHINGKLWTGDKKLISGLQKKRYLKTISTNDLYEQFLENQTAIRRRSK
jgi:predicted nucleic acid-binding protein